MSNCCPTDVLPVKTTYQSQGAKMYLTGKGTKALIYIPDIFGPHPNTYHVCDLLAAKGYMVLMPDFFCGSTEWPLSDFPPKDGFGGKFQTFLQGLNYTHMRHVVVEAVTILKALGCTKIGAVGMCWGGKIGIRANCEGLLTGSVCAHPFMLEDVDAKDLKTPVCLLPTKDEDAKNMEAYMAEAAKHPFHALNVHKRFEQMHHGFLAARGDFNDEANRKAAEEALDIVDKFFHSVFAM